jgi:hypothetical protein
MNCSYPHNKRHIMKQNTGILINALSVQAFSWPRFKTVVSRTEMRTATHLYPKFRICNCTEHGPPRELIMSLFQLWESSRSNSHWSSIKIFKNRCLILTVGNDRHACLWSLPARINWSCQAQFTTAKWSFYWIEVHYVPLLQNLSQLLQWSGWTLSLHRALF